MSASVGAPPWQNVPVAALAGELRLDCLETHIAPVAAPAVLLRLGRAQRAGQVIQHTQVVERVDVAGDRERERAHAGATGGVRRQQRRLRGRLVEPLDDGERLGHHVAVVGDERRHEPLRIQRQVVVVALRPAAQMNEGALRGETFEVERDPDAIRRRRAEVVVELHASVPAFISGERRDARLCATEDQRVDVVRAFVRIDGLEVQQVPDHVELVDDAVAAVHVARHPRDLERLAAGIALHDRRDLRRRLAFVLHPAEAQAALQPERDLGLHVGELFLDELVRGERAAELLAIERVLARGVPAGLRRAQRAPRDAVARAVEAAERARRGPCTFGSRWSAGTGTSSITISPVTDVRRLNLPSIFGADSPFIPFSRMKPRITPSSVFAQTTNTSAIGEFEIHILLPTRR